jgi:uncharacterized membrane protein YsdA (DUF1294 family)
VTARFAALPLLSALLLALVLRQGLGLDPLLAWLVAISLAAFLTYGYDKSIAGTGKTRVPERALLLLAVVGGTIGAYLGMRFFHHKTLKGSFQRRFWLIAAGQAGLILLYIFLL